MVARDSGRIRQTGSKAPSPLKSPLARGAPSWSEGNTAAAAGSAGGDDEAGGGSAGGAAEAEEATGGGAAAEAGGADAHKQEVLERKIKMMLF